VERRQRGVELPYAAVDAVQLLVRSQTKKPAEKSAGFFYWQQLARKNGN
jgi:hypothetical protein